MTRTRVIQKVRDVREQQAETFRYWQTRTPSERAQAVFELTRDGMGMPQRESMCVWNDQKDTLPAFNAHGAEYLIVAQAVAVTSLQHKSANP